MIDFDTFRKMPTNVGNFGKLIVAKGFKNKSPNLVTLERRVRKREKQQ